MGYTTKFDGRFDLDKPLKPEHAAYLKAFSETRRMKRDLEITLRRPDPTREAAGLPIGHDGGYFVGGGGFHGQEQIEYRPGERADDAYRRIGILDYNLPPGCPDIFSRLRDGALLSNDAQPGLWCQWVPTEDNQGIEWNGGEKFYDYTEWLGYLIRHFLGPWGYAISGSVRWQGESPDDRGTIQIVNGKPEAIKDDENEPAVPGVVPSLIDAARDAVKWMDDEGDFGWDDRAVAVLRNLRAAIAAEED